jgi:hypothetical protein
LHTVETAAILETLETRARWGRRSMRKTILDVPWPWPGLSLACPSVPWPVPPSLLEQVPPLLGRDFGQLLFGGREQTLEPDDDKIAEQVGVYVPGAPAPGFLLKASDPCAGGGLDFYLGFHGAGNSETVANICSTFPKSPGLTRW